MFPLMTLIWVVSFYHVVVVVEVGGATNYEVDVNFIDQPPEILTAECYRPTSNGLVAIVLKQSADRGKVLARVKCGKPHCVELKVPVAAFGYKSSGQDPSILVIAWEPSLSLDIHKDRELLCEYHVHAQAKSEPAVVRRRPAKKLRLKVPKPQGEANTNFTLLMDLQDSQRRWNPIFGEREGPTGGESSWMGYDPEEGLLTKMVDTPDFSEATLLISNDSQFYTDTKWQCQMKGEKFSERKLKKKQFYIPCKAQGDQACVPNDSNTTVFIIAIVVLGVLLLVFVCCLCYMCRKRKKKSVAQSPPEDVEMRTPIDAEDKKDTLLHPRDDSY